MKINFSQDNFLIITHKRPDGDTLGSASALCEILRNYGKTAFVLQNPDITPKFEYLVKDYYPTNDFNPSCIITVDVATKELLTLCSKDFDIDINIDHHYLSNTNFAKTNIVENFASCGELIYEIMVILGISMNEKIATALYISISTDTGCFKYSSTTAHTFMVASKCLEVLGDVSEINKKLFDTKTKPRIEMEKRILNNMVFAHNNEINLIHVLVADKLETGATSDDLDNIASLGVQIEGVLLGITLSEQENGDVKISVRSSSDTASACEVCSKFGGGGHLRASGGILLNTPISVATEKLLAFACEVLDNV